MKDLKRATEEGLGATFMLDGENCIIKESISSAGNWGWDHMVEGLYKLAEAHATINMRFDSTTDTHVDGPEVFINLIQATTHPYFTKKNANGTCSTHLSNATFTLASAIAHELGHLYGTGFDGGDMALQWENVVHWRQARPFRVWGPKCGKF